ncbi:ABC transporter substrate-binding protein [Streptomyces piniterrae]|uniref:ABC transporter substrate-binding protein n=1 Tax=Streptomyces piniterrae TaxID=2571125 RepID=A0A4U0NWW6_9ACTN|nr:ABC transporter substrate-binding protein [Streptomyces piniterrae]TJZ59223.1 ABC transporter substrate-binding protein [Streptomyces piniterrae]
MRGAMSAKWAVCAAAVALVAGACGGDTDTDAVVRASWGDPQNPLEPANTIEVRGSKALDMIFRGLKKYDPKSGAAKNWIAESITTGDQRNFTVKVKKGWKFSNGEPVTAHSFVDAWNYGASVANKQANAIFFSHIDGYDEVRSGSGGPRAKTMSGLVVKDDYTFTVRLTQKFSAWPGTLGYWAYYPLPKAFFTHHAAWLRNPIGNGPYEITSYDKGSLMKLRRWKGYQGPDKARNEGVDLRVYTDTDTAYTDLRTGLLDLVDDIPVGELKSVKRDLSSRYINQPVGLIGSIAFPLYHPKWNGPKSAELRRGIAMAIDRSAIATQLFRKTRTPATDWTSPALGVEGGYKPGLCGAVCTYNPSQARKLIQEAGGLPGGQMKIMYNADVGSNKVWVDAVCNSINGVLDNDLACVGDPVGTFADFRNRITSESATEPFSAGWQMTYPLIQGFLQPRYHSGGWSNDTHFHSARFDELINQANAESHTAKAVETFQEAEKILAQQMPLIPLWYQNGNVGYSSRLSRVSLNPSGVPDYSQIKVAGPDQT